MPIELGPAGFFEFHDHPFCRESDPPGPGLGVRSDRISEFVEVFAQGNFAGIFGSPSTGFALFDLDFLRLTPRAVWLWLWDVKLKNVEGMDALGDLKYLGICAQRPGIDFGRLPRVKSCVNHWNARDSGFEHSKIETYRLWKCNPKDKSFASVRFPREVKSLELNWANPDSIAGMPVMERLERLEFHYCRNLRELTGLARIAPNLRHLIVDRCRKCDSDGPILDHPSLRHACVNGRIVIDGRSR